jgi:hypothetical protein
MPRHRTSQDLLQAVGRAECAGLSSKWTAQACIGQSQTLSADHLLQLGDVLNLSNLQYLDHRRGDTAGNFESNDIVLEHLLSQQ